MNGSSPEVSVIIAAYNAEEFLTECLDSLKVQTYDNFEVLLVDDGSTDGTPRIALEFEDNDNRFRSISIPNGGVSHARNYGMDMAKGKYITFVDADDVLYPDALKAMCDCLESQGGDVCITGFRSSRTRGEFKLSRSRAETYNYEQAMQAALYQKRIFNAPWGVMMRRTLIGESKRFREDTRYEDLDAFYRFFDGADKIIYLPSKYYFYRKNPGSFINSWSDSRLDVLDVTDRMVDYFSLNYPELRPAAEDRRFSAHYNMLMLMVKNKVGNPEAMERCLKIIRRYRRQIIADGNVRLKNKAGALISYLGLPFMKLMAKVAP